MQEERKCRGIAVVKVTVNVRQPDGIGGGTEKVSYTISNIALKSITNKQLLD